MKNLDLAKLQALSLSDSLPHAWIFQSNDLNFALERTQFFARWLLCLQKQEFLPCDTCKSCNLVFEQVHPDYSMLQPNEGKDSILIEDVRKLIEFSTTKPQFGKYKAAIIYPAEAMHQQSANALLKTLEEPPSDTIYILVSRNKELLPKTIISRCHELNIYSSFVLNEGTRDSIEIMVTDLVNIWLDKSVTASQIVEKWLKLWPKEMLYWFEIVITDLIVLKYTGNPDLTKVWCSDEKKLCNVLPSQKIWTILERLRAAKIMLVQNRKPNMQLIVEDMLLI